MLGYTDQGIRSTFGFYILRGIYIQDCFAINENIAKLVITDDLGGICILLGLFRFPKPATVISKELK